MKDTAAKIILSPLMLRVAWQFGPSFVICTLFWLAVTRSEVQLYRRLELRSSRLLALVMGLGMTMNALVTLINGGYMPVVGEHDSFSLWVTSTEATRLLWLADHTDWWGFSIGDAFIIGGAVARMAACGFRKAAEILSYDRWASRECGDRRRRLTATRSTMP